MSAAKSIVICRLDLWFRYGSKVSNCPTCSRSIIIFTDLFSHKEAQKVTKTQTWSLDLILSFFSAFLCILMAQIWFTFSTDRCGQATRLTSSKSCWFLEFYGRVIGLSCSDWFRSDFLYELHHFKSLALIQFTQDNFSVSFTLHDQVTCKAPIFNF